jgi:hypothetical protein
MTNLLVKNRKTRLQQPSYDFILYENVLSWTQDAPKPTATMKLMEVLQLLHQVAVV